MIATVVVPAIVIAAGASMCAKAAPFARMTTPTVRVVRCHTGFGVTPGRITVPSTIAVRGNPSSTNGLVAYTNTQEFLIAPAHLACAGEVGADGNGTIVAWPRGKREPHLHSRTPGLTLTVIPACVGCMAFSACPFFRAFAAKLGFPCTSGVPSGEQVESLGPRLVAFHDPPGVAGDGWPSGGSDPANGITGIKGKYGVVYTSTCTLPAREHSACTVSLDDAIARYG